MITFKRYLLTLVALLAMTTGAWADEGTLLVTITPDGSGIPVYSVDGIATLDKGAAVYNTSKACWTKGDLTSLTVTVAEVINVTKVKFNCYGGNSWEDKDAPYQVFFTNFSTFSDEETLSRIAEYGVTSIEVYGTYAPAGPKVTTDAAQAGDPFTTASFAMPASDATVSYELVRDLSESVNFLGIPTGNGATVKKDGDKYTFATAPIITLSDVLNPSEATTIFYYNDGFSYVESGLTLNVYPMVEMEGFPGYYKTDETATPVALTDFLASPQPGRWKIKATATTGPYDGTLYSPEFTLAEAYDLTLSPATDAHLQSVTVAGTAKTADEKGVIRGIEPTKKVKITTTGPDYIIRKATVKKTVKQ